MEQPRIFASKAVWHTSIFDLNDLITELYQLKKPFEGHVDASNDSDHEISVDGVVDQYMAKDVKTALKQGNIEIWKLRCLLNDMCRQEWILPGNYLVKVSW